MLAGDKCGLAICYIGAIMFHRHTHTLVILLLLLFYLYLNIMTRISFHKIKLCPTLLFVFKFILHVINTVRCEFGKQFVMEILVQSK